jgi:hypothetical protein
MSRIRCNENYWAMSLKDNIIHHLPKLLNKVHCDMISKFMERNFHSIFYMFVISW